VYWILQEFIPFAIGIKLGYPSHCAYIRSEPVSICFLMFLLLFVSLHFSHDKNEVFIDGIVRAAVLDIVKKEREQSDNDPQKDRHSEPFRSVSMNFSLENVELGTASFHPKSFRRLTSSQHSLVWQRDTEAMP
jgi:hypothetical protein